MSNFKKILAFIVASTVVLSAVGCGGENGDVTDTTKVESTIVSTNVSEPAETTEQVAVTEEAEAFNEVLAKDADFAFSVVDGKATVVGFSGEANTVIIPDTYDGAPVTAIGDEAFSGFTGIKKLVIPEGITVIGKRAFYNCQGLTEVVIPNGVTEIGDLAFAVCMELTSATVPESVESVGYLPFFSCSELVLKCKQGSYIDEYAKGKEIAVEYIG